MHIHNDKFGEKGGGSVAMTYRIGGMLSGRLGWLCIIFRIVAL